MKKGHYVIYITIKTPRITISNEFDLANYENVQEQVKAAKDWIRKED